MRIAHEHGVPAIAVQHHHAHIAVLQAQRGGRVRGAGSASGAAEFALDAPLIGLALDGVGLGSDGLAWGGEVLALRGARCVRVAHLPLLALPGGDVAAREPWRLAAAVLHELGRGDEIVSRLGPLVGSAPARVVQAMLARGYHCPRSSGAGRWFDACAGALGLCLRQSHEAEAAQALQGAATAWMATHARPAPASATLDLWPLLAQALDTPRDADAIGAVAAQFHLQLAAGLVAAACAAAAQTGAEAVALGGGCFFNALLTDAVVQGLRAAGLQPLQTSEPDCGDAGLALGQAWAAALQFAAGATHSRAPGHADEILEPT